MDLKQQMDELEKRLKEVFAESDKKNEEIEKTLRKNEERKKHVER